MLRPKAVKYIYQTPFLEIVVCLLCDHKRTIRGLIDVNIEFLQNCPQCLRFCTLVSFRDDVMGGKPALIFYSKRFADIACKFARTTCASGYKILSCDYFPERAEQFAFGEVPPADFVQYLDVRGSYSGFRRLYEDSIFL